MRAGRMQEAALVGVARYVEWRRRLLADVSEDRAREMLAGLFAMLPPEMKERVKADNPEAFARAQDWLRGRSGAGY